MATTNTTDQPMTTAQQAAAADPADWYQLVRAAEMAQRALLAFAGRDDLAGGRLVVDHLAEQIQVGQRHDNRRFIVIPCARASTASATTTSSGPAATTSPGPRLRRPSCAARSQTCARPWPWPTPRSSSTAAEPSARPGGPGPRRHPHAMGPAGAGAFLRFRARGMRAGSRRTPRRA